MSIKQKAAEGQAGTSLAEQLDAYATSVRANRPAGWAVRLRGWTPYAAAVGSGLALATAADAGVIYSGVQDLSLSVNNGPGNRTSSHYLGIGLGRFSLLLRFSRAGGLVEGVADLFNNDVDSVIHNATGGVKRLASGAVISNGKAFDNAVRLVSRTEPGGQNSGTWPKSAMGFAGVKFTSRGQTFFGWIRLEWQDTTNQGYPNKLTAIDWAYNDVAGAPIDAGQLPTTTTTPEPSSMALALMAAGCAGVLAWRKRRQANPTATSATSSEP